MPPRPPTGIRRRERAVSSAVGFYIVVLLALQIFLLAVALDALQAGNDAMAWSSAGISVLLALGSGLFYRYLRR